MRPALTGRIHDRLYMVYGFCAGLRRGSIRSVMDLVLKVHAFLDVVTPMIDVEYVQRRMTAAGLLFSSSTTIVGLVLQRQLTGLDSRTQVRYMLSFHYSDDSTTIFRTRIRPSSSPMLRESLLSNSISILSLGHLLNPLRLSTLFYRNHSSL